MSQGGLPVERFLTVNVKLIMSEGQLKKNTISSYFRQAGVKSIFVVTVVSGFHLQCLNSLYKGKFVTHSQPPVTMSA